MAYDIRIRKLPGSDRYRVYAQGEALIASCSERLAKSLVVAQARPTKLMGMFGGKDRDTPTDRECRIKFKQWTRAHFGGGFFNRDKRSNTEKLQIL